MLIWSICRDISALWWSCWVASYSTSIDSRELQHYNLYLLSLTNSCVNHPISTSNEGFVKLLALGFWKMGVREVLFSIVRTSFFFSFNWGAYHHLNSVPTRFSISSHLWMRNTFFLWSTGITSLWFETDHRVSLQHEILILQGVLSQGL